MHRFFVEVRVLLPIEARSPEAAERIATAKVVYTLQPLKSATVAGARTVDPDAATRPTTRAPDDILVGR